MLVKVVQQKGRDDIPKPVLWNAPPGVPLGTGDTLPDPFGIEMEPLVAGAPLVAAFTSPTVAADILAGHP